MSDSTEDFAVVLMGTIKEYRGRYRRGEVCWSLAHYAMVFGGLLASFLATLTLNFDWHSPTVTDKQIATALTALATFLGSLGAAGGFQGKWRSNRLSRSQLDCINIDLSNPKKDATVATTAATALKQAISLHDAQIVDADKDARSKPDDTGAADKAARDKAAADKVAADKAANDKVAADKAANDKADADKVAGEAPAPDDAPR